MKFTLSVPPDFNLMRTVYSHGWSSLPPFSVQKDRLALRQIIRLAGGKTVSIQTTAKDNQTLVIEPLSARKLTAPERREIVAIVRSSLRLGEDISEFYTETQKHPRFRWVSKTGAGRLLRAPTVFEDVVKMICTTNCSWALTETMVRNLCAKLGTPIPDAGCSFPEPQAIADCSEKFLRKEIRAGYRSPYLLELSKRIVNKDIDIESWRHSALQTDELFEQVRSVKGVGPYAAGNILKLLGRYDYLAIDSWCRKQFFGLHKNGRTTSDKVIEKFYASFGKWRGLFFWLDVTKHWYDKQFPF